MKRLVLYSLIVVFILTAIYLSRKDKYDVFRGIRDSKCDIDEVLPYFLYFWLFNNRTFDEVALISSNAQWNVKIGSAAPVPMVLSDLKDIKGIGSGDKGNGTGFWLKGGDLIEIQPINGDTGFKLDPKLYSDIAKLFLRSTDVMPTSPNDSSTYKDKNNKVVLPYLDVFNGKPISVINFSCRTNCQSFCGSINPYIKPQNSTKLLSTYGFCSVFQYWLMSKIKSHSDLISMLGTDIDFTVWLVNPSLGQSSPSGWIDRFITFWKMISYNRSVINGVARQPNSLTTDDFSHISVYKLNSELYNALFEKITFDGTLVGNLNFPGDSTGYKIVLMPFPIIQTGNSTAANTDDTPDLSPQFILSRDKLAGDAVVANWIALASPSPDTPNVINKLFQQFINDRDFTLPIITTIPYLTDIVSDFGGMKTGDLYAFMCCYEEARKNMDRKLRNILCSGKYNYDGNNPSGSCDTFMQSNWCAVPIPDQAECGCEDSYPIDTTTIEGQIYEKLKDNVPPLPKQCIIPSCVSGLAYKTSSERNQKCPSICAQIINAQGGDFSTIDFNNVTMQLTCGDGGQMTTKSCTTVADCASGFDCIGGVCVKPKHECEKDIDCKNGFYCSKDNKCIIKPIPEPDCSTTKPCPDGYHCENGKCILNPPPTPECSDSKPCGDGYYCDNGKCKPKTPPSKECSDTVPCASGYHCENGKCVADPPKPECSQDSDCGDGYCIKGKCIPKPECMEDTDCKDGYHCDGGNCVQNQPSPSGKSNTVLYIGLGVGGFFLLCLIVYIVYMYKNRQ